jgi:3-keto-5-aminohexanoate cleavage enzyme
MAAAGKSIVAPLIVSVAVCGGEHGREATPHLPITPREIAESIRAARAAGAAIAHVHVFGEDGRPSPEVAPYAEVLEHLGDCDIVVNLTTAPGGSPSDEERMLALRGLAPEIASFDAGSMNFGDGLFANELPFLRTLASAMLEVGTRPEVEIFDEGMLATALRLRDEGLLEDPLWCQFVLGVRGGAPANARTLVHLVGGLPPGTRWSVTGIGRGSVPMAMHAIAMGGNVRVGLEDSVRFSGQRLAVSNAELVERVVALARIADREVATPEQARELLALNGSRPLAL